MARVRALLRRPAGRQGAAFSNGDLRLDPVGRRCWRGDHEIDLTGRELSVLTVLLQRVDLVVPKAELVQPGVGDRFRGDPNIVEVYIGRLRRKLDEPFGANDIETIRGVGYRLNGRVRRAVGYEAASRPPDSAGCRSGPRRPPWPSSSSSSPSPASAWSACSSGSRTSRSTSASVSPSSGPGSSSTGLGPRARRSKAKPGATTTSRRSRRAVSSITAPLRSRVCRRSIDPERARTARTSLRTVEVDGVGSLRTHRHDVRRRHRRDVRQPPERGRRRGRVAHPDTAPRVPVREPSGSGPWSGSWSAAPCVRWTRPCGGSAGSSPTPATTCAAPSPASGRSWRPSRRPGRAGAEPGGRAGHAGPPRDHRRGPVGPGPGRRDVGAPASGGLSISTRWSCARSGWVGRRRSRSTRPVCRPARSWATRATSSAWSRTS